VNIWAITGLAAGAAGASVALGAVTVAMGVVGASQVETAPVAFASVVATVVCTVFSRLAYVRWGTLYREIDDAFVDLRETAAQADAAMLEAPIERIERSLDQLPRRRGRPGGTRRYDRESLLAEYQRIRRSTGRRPTQWEFCDMARPRIEVRTLQDYLRDYGMAWPPE
jgi:hypothetical protein